MINVRHGPGPAGQPVEIVERKGLGHPDTLADALAERMSVAYSRHCLERFGAVLHHNLDKLYLRGGHCQIGLGTFEMTDPVTLTIGGRVSSSFSGEPIDHRELFEDVARSYLGTVLPRFDHARWLRVEHATTDRSRFPAWFHPRGLQDLPELANPVASDTAVVTAWWPDTLAERVTLALERHLNQEGTGPRYPELGHRPLGGHQHRHLRRDHRQAARRTRPARRQRPCREDGSPAEPQHR
jgi:S-adenosylmethionine synthetase